MTVTNPEKIKDNRVLWVVLVKKLHVLFMGLVTLFLWVAMSTTQAHANNCQQAHKKIQAHLKKANSLRDKWGNLSRVEADIAYLEIERELLSLAKKDTLHHCDFSDLSHVGLEHIVSDDDTFHIYRWATDYEVTESIGYTTIMYAQPKQPNLKPAVYINRNSSGDFSPPITITKPKRSNLGDKEFPIYGVAIKNYIRGQYRIHCEPSISLFRVNQHQRFGYIRDIGFNFLDAKGKEIDTRVLFGSGCDGDQRTKNYIADNQFSYNAKTEVLSFRVSVMTGFDKETFSGSHEYKHYRFRFNGTDFVQLIDPK